jgi:hypothetical protein
VVKSFIAEKWPEMLVAIGFGITFMAFAVPWL